MSKTKVSWLLALADWSPTDNFMHFAHLLKQIGVDYVFMTKILLIAW